MKPKNSQYQIHLDNVSIKHNKYDVQQYQIWQMNILQEYQGLQKVNVNENHKRKKTKNL
jgi:hypothetical protein